MIIDTLANAERYQDLYPGFREAFDYIRGLNLDEMEAGKYPVTGTAQTASVSAKKGVSADDAKFEAHNQNIDIQVCISGTEKIGWKPRGACQLPQGGFNTEKDVIFYGDAPDMYFQLQGGQFAIFFPEDAHAPMIGEGLIKKMVVKVKL